MGKRLFSGDASPLPDNLRCRRSDGRQWRCPQPAKSGLTFCEYHYQQVRRNQDNIKNTKVGAAAATEPEPKLLFTDDSSLWKKRRRRMKKDPSAVEPVLTEKMEGGDVEKESPDLKSNRDISLPDQFRHQLSECREWHCSQPPMPVRNFCDRRHLRCKRLNEENNKVIEPKSGRSPRFVADLMPSIKRQWRRPPLKGETRANEAMMIFAGEEGWCDMKGADPAVTLSLPIPDTLRCRRSDGRKWRCPQPSIPGLSFCEYHHMRCKQTYNKNTRVKVAKPERGSQFLVDPQQLTTRSRRWGVGELLAEDPMRIEHNDEGLKANKMTTPELNLYDEDLLCCKENDSKNNEAEQWEEEVDAAEPSTSEEMDTVEPTTPDLHVSDVDPQWFKEEDNRNKEAAAKPTCMLQLAGDLQPSMKSTSLPDHLRCRRSDGRKWRCPQLSMLRVGFCEYHFLQLQRNQGKRKNRKLASGAKRKRGLRLASNQSLARNRRRQRLKRQLTGEEPIRATRKEERHEGMEATNLEVTRDLPNGVMAILPAPARGPANPSPWFHWKIGSDDGHLFGRSFRSKNAELVPLGKKLPFIRRAVGGRNKVCHRCSARENKVERSIRCFNCQEFFCATCIDAWPSELSILEIKMSCPVCRGCCTCINCNSRRDEDVAFKKL